MNQSHNIALAAAKELQKMLIHQGVEVPIRDIAAIIEKHIAPLAERVKELKNTLAALSK